MSYGESSWGLDSFRHLGSSLSEQMLIDTQYFFYSSSEGRSLRIVYCIYLPLTHNQVASLTQTPSFLPSGVGRVIVIRHPCTREHNLRG